MLSCHLLVSLSVCTLLELLDDSAVEVVTLGVAIFIKYVSLMVLSSIDVSGLLLWTVRSVVAYDIV